MNPNNYYIRGPINAGSRVLLSTTIENKLYFLTSSGTNLIFDPRNPLLIGGPVPLSLVTAETNNNTQINFATTNGAKVGVDPVNMFARLSNTVTNMTPGSDVNFPDLVVAGGEYEFTINNNPVGFHRYVPIGTTGSTGSTGATGDTGDTGGINSVFASGIQVDSNGNPILETVTNNIRIVPIKWFRAGNCTVIPNNIGQVITDEALWVLSQISIIVGYPTGYTIQSQCNQDVFYEYCVDGEVCGTNNCNGICTSSSATCKLDSNNNFNCGNTSSSWWWWVLMGVLALVILIIIIMIFYYAFRSPDKKYIQVVGDSTSSIYTESFIPEYNIPEYNVVEYGSY